ncbi:hypothetical protein PAXRUDRAFT_824898 [Paxillus rubicundulus Ve08.2h10]|uniref:Uncharacterized protein n=1 Tax=Paxillus rubicundulus Ve08.2h10 TaxID=930991 RepID=A0A0D0EBE2_9AGAM|nr:hypothetical protein PAXRUDRAFT_824898 [Paxillus rubicundulus Ve08.2h10]
MSETGQGPFCKRKFGRREGALIAACRASKLDSRSIVLLLISSPTLRLIVWHRQFVPPKINRLQVP